MNYENLKLKLNIQHFARKKNALTEYFVGPVDEEKATLKLAKWINNVSDDADEETEDYADYAGDGTPATDVISVKKAYAFEGMFDEEDEAMAFVAEKEFDTGEGRKVMFKQVRTNGDTYEGIATLSGVKVTGGEASEYALFECTISWDNRPEKTSTP